MFRERFLVKEY